MRLGREAEREREEESKEKMMVMHERDQKMCGQECNMFGKYWY
jgi:hypothetical protein